MSDNKTPNHLKKQPVVYLRVPQKLYRRLNAELRALRVTKSEFIRTLLAQYLAQ